MGQPGEIVVKGHRYSRDTIINPKRMPIVFGTAGSTR